MPPDTTVVGRKFLTHGEWVERKRAKCEHAFTAVCVNCAPLSESRHVYLPGCPKHAPWPRGICTSCGAPPVELRNPEYRHVDYIQVHNYTEMGGFITLWDGNAGAGVQRMGVLFGRYKSDSNYRKGVKAVVEAIYEPPQSYDPMTGVVTPAKSDPGRARVDAIAAALGLEVVGWIVTTPPTPPGAPEVSPALLYAMAQAQLAHPAPGGGSRHVTLVVRRGAGGEIAPQGYMASDQLMALVRDRVVAPPSPGDVLFKKRVGGPGEPPLPDIVRTSSLRGRYKSDVFEPEYAVVTLQAGRGHEEAGKEAEDGGPLFKHGGEFPAEGREAFGGQGPSPGEVSRVLRARGGERTPGKLSEWSLLLYIGKMLDVSGVGGGVGWVGMHHRAHFHPPFPPQVGTAVAMAKVVAGGETTEGVELMMGSLSQ